MSKVCLKPKLQRLGLRIGLFVFDLRVVAHRMLLNRALSSNYIEKRYIEMQ